MRNSRAIRVSWSRTVAGLPQITDPASTSSANLASRIRG